MASAGDAGTSKAETPIQREPELEIGPDTPAGRRPVGEGGGRDEGRRI